MDKDFTLTVTFDYGKFEYAYDTFEEARTAEREFRNQHATHFSLSTPKSRAWIEASKDATKIIDQPRSPKMKTSSKTRRAVKKYGKDVCEKALYQNEVIGNGSCTIGIELGLTTNQADAAINAGRDIRSNASEVDRLFFVTTSVESKSTLALMEYRRRFGGMDADYDASVTVALTARGWA